jgi:uncharacterized protein YqjF (DUF2071 family)
MKLPTIQGIIRRRILVNYRVDPQVMQPLIPSRFRPKLHDGQAVAGICLIRLEHIRPKRLPEIIGVSSENAAHRVAVLWDDEQGSTREGVFIPRRDTNSQMNHLLGGRVFPGQYHLAEFNIHESATGIDFAMKSSDATVAVNVTAQVAELLPPSSIFASLPEASAFFENGSLGFSVTSDPHRLDGIQLATKEWRVEPLAVHQVYSSFFADESRFPKGSVEFDHALLMRNIAHEWHQSAELHI